MTTEIQRQNLRFAITGYYLEVLKLKNQRNILVKNIAQSQKMIEQIQHKNEEGIVLKNSITRYELQKQSLNISLLQLNNTLVILNNELVKTLDLPKGTQL
ncbi:MAG: TolC family protein, partial [Gelidibacter sp.]